MEKHIFLKNQYESELTNKDEKLKVMRVSMQKLERENNNHVFEIEKLSKFKKDLTEESKIIYFWL